MANTFEQHRANFYIKAFGSQICKLTCWSCSAKSEAMSDRRKQYLQHKLSKINESKQSVFSVTYTQERYITFKKK